MDRHEGLTIATRGLQAAVVNTLIALALTLFGDRPFGQNLLYSQLIGLSIWALIDVGRLWLITNWETQWSRLVFLVPAAVVAGYLLGTLAGDAVLARAPGDAWLAQPRRTLGLLALSLLAGSTVTYYFLSRERIAALREREATAQRLAAESRLKLLEAQLEPHMLFNTLANLRALIGVDPGRAQDMLDHLIDYLRATLGASRATTHPLAHEFNRLRDYLELMAVRMGSRLTYALHLPAGLENAPVPTLLLQPLVENSVLHGLEPAREGGHVSISARREGGALVLDVCDSGVGMGAAASSDGAGFGLTQVRERLATLYGAAASLELAPAQPRGARAVVRLPASPA